MERDQDVRTVERFLEAFNKHRPDRLLRLTTQNQSITLPDGTYAQGRLATGRLIGWVFWRSRGTLRLTPLAVQARGEHEVLVRRNTARRSRLALDLEMTMTFTVDHGRVSAIRESVEDLQAWLLFWR